MKKYLFILLILSIYTTGSGFKIVGQVNSAAGDAIYARSCYSDLSFEGRLSIDKKEMDDLNYYFKTYTTEKNTGDIYQTLISKILNDAASQYKFMNDNGIDLEDLRQRPSELSLLDNSALKKYYFNLFLVENKFALTNDDLIGFNKLIDMSLKIASYRLSYSLSLCQQYLNLGKKIKYTPLEILQDVTGFESPEKFYSNTVSPLVLTRPNQGLSGKSSVQKMLDFGDISSVQTTIYPNPFVSTTKIQIYSDTKGKLECSIYDITGRIVRALVNTDAALNYTELEWDGTDNKGTRLNNGLYICIVHINGKKEINKIVINN